MVVEAILNGTQPPTLRLADLEGAFSSIGKSNSKIRLYDESNRLVLLVTHDSWLEFGSLRQHS